MQCHRQVTKTFLPTATLGYLDTATVVPQNHAMLGQ